MVKVLVVDDDGVSRLVLEHLLVNMGLQVEASHSLDGAIAALSQSLIHLVIGAHRLPGNTGLDLCDALVDCPIPFVLLGGPIERRRASDTRLDGVSAFLSEPISTTELHQIVNELITSPIV